MSTIVCFSNIDWGFLRYRKQHLMRQLARSHHVVYVNPPRARKASAPFSWNRLRMVDHHLSVYEPPVLPTGRMTGASTAWSVSRLRRVLRRLDSPPVISWCYSPHALRFLGRLDEDLRVYDLADDYTSPIDLEIRSEHERREIARLTSLEQRLMGEVDLVLAVSHALAEKKRSIRADVHVVPNGCDFERFAADAGPEPPDIEALRRPRLAFVGAIWPRVDIDALVGLANRFAGGSVVLVGPALPGLDISRLVGRPNVWWLGSKSHDELPRYLQHVDVGLLPYKPTELTRCSSPLKLWEYLAAGCAVASVPIPQVEEIAGSVVSIAPADRLSSAVEEALRRESPQMRAMRRQVAQRSDWSRRAVQVERLLEAALQCRLPRENFDAERRSA